MVKTVLILATCLVFAARGQHNPTANDDDDLFSSVAKMEGLVEQEETLINVLKAYLKGMHDRIEIIQRYISTCQEDLSRGQSPSKLVANPVDAFLLVKKLTIDWDAVENVMKADINATENVLNSIGSMRGNAILPTSEDLNGAAIALVKLQDTYKLNVSDFASGSFRGTGGSKDEVFHSKHEMNGRDCFFVAQHAFVKGYYDAALEWGRTAMSRANATYEGNANLTADLQKEIRRFLRDAAHVHDDILDHQGPRGLNWQTNVVPVSKRLQSDHSDKYDTLAEYKFVPKLYQVQTEDEETEHYERLCRGEKLRSPLVESRLFCRLVHRNEPYLLLQPVKVEEHSLDPRIVVFHDILSDKQTDILMELAKPKLKSSKHMSDKGFVRSLIRTSKNAWLTEAENASLPVMRHRLELATGLILGPETAAEQFQIANYGIGGLYMTHTDNLIHNDNPNAWELIVGDRIATLMVYLTNVEAGGATVFPRAGVTLWPQRGSAAFWWNLYRKGDADTSTRHGACPVLHGSKWVFNKWVRQYDQMFRAKCGLQQFEKFTTL